MAFIATACALLCCAAPAFASVIGELDGGAIRVPARSAAPPAGSFAEVADVIPIDARSPSTPFPHFWERMFGSERAMVTLRESWRNDLRSAKRATGFEYVRFHAIFHDELGVYDEDAVGKPVYNFTYVDEVYDGLLANGVRPFVELSFMPRKLSSKPDSSFGFWYKPNVAPPKDWDRWEALVEAFGRHLVQRYGEEEVARWYFEVWNEPNIGFWDGEPKEPTYYELYDRAARALKRVSPRLRVGGPSTSAASWVDRFIAHCAEKNVPVDFVSTHFYANDPEGSGGPQDTRETSVCAAARKVHDQVSASARPNLPIIWSEFGATFWNESNVTDTAFMAPWIASVAGRCDGLADMMSYWTFSDVFEEGGVPASPFYGGFGLIAQGGVAKPGFNAFALLHRLGEERLRVDSPSALATKRADGSLAVAVWNSAPPGAAGTARSLVLQFSGVPPRARASVTIIDSSRGSALPLWERMGRPRYPTQEQLRQLRAAAALPAPARERLSGGAIALTLPSPALALVEIR